MGTGSMIVYDRLLTFPTEAAAAEALPHLRGPIDESGTIGWLPGPIVGAKLVRAEAIWDDADPDHPVLISPADIAPGWTIDDMQPSPMITEAVALGVPYLIANRDAALRGEPFIVATNYSPAQISAVKRVSPEPAGAGYPFGG